MFNTYENSYLKKQLKNTDFNIISLKSPNKK